MQKPSSESFLTGSLLIAPQQSKEFFYTCFLQALINAWETDQRVKALKIAIQVCKASNKVSLGSYER